jgi:hypothetical protein
MTRDIKNDRTSHFWAERQTLVTIKFFYTAKLQAVITKCSSVGISVSSR